METKTWEELVKAWLEEVKERFAEAKERLAKSEARLAYMDTETMLFLHKKVKANLASIEAHLEGMRTFVSDTKQSAVMKVEVQLAETEVQLAKVEKELLLEMIEFDMSVGQESKMTTRFIEEEAVRLAEAEVRLLEAELRLLEKDIDLMIATVDPVPDQISQWLYHADMALQDWHNGEDRPDLDDAFWQRYNEMTKLEISSQAAAKADAGVTCAEARVQLTEAKVRLSEAELRLAKAKLRLTKTFDMDDYL